MFTGLSHASLVFFDWAFLIFHNVLIVFNLFGWIFPRTRRLNLLTLLITAASWFLLGIWYGIGYCPCTDWHWQVRIALGDFDLPRSYITFLIERFTGFRPEENFVDIATGIAFGTAILASAWVNYSAWKVKRPAPRVNAAD